MTAKPKQTLREEVYSAFERDVKDHAMTIVRDDGVNRHIRFKKPDTICMSFDLITWPGHLCYTGDMGTFVFTRTTDMFEFFRTDKGRINPGYWGEKLIASNCHGAHSQQSGAMEFSKDKFKAAIMEYLVEWIRSAKESGRLDKDERRELWKEVVSDVIDGIDETPHGCQQIAHDFTFERNGHSWYFQDLFERSFDEFTFHFLWCCYALAWGIGVYDAFKEPETI